MKKNRINRTAIEAEFKELLGCIKKDSDSDKGVVEESTKFMTLIYLAAGLVFKMNPTLGQIVIEREDTELDPEDNSDNKTKVFEVTDKGHKYIWAVNGVTDADKFIDIWESKYKAIEEDWTSAVGFLRASGREGQRIFYVLLEGGKGVFVLAANMSDAYRMVRSAMRYKLMPKKDVIDGASVEVDGIAGFALYNASRRMKNISGSVIPRGTKRISYNSKWDILEYEDFVTGEHKER